MLVPLFIESAISYPKGHSYWHTGNYSGADNILLYIRQIVFVRRTGKCAIIRIWDDVMVANLPTETGGVLGGSGILTEYPQQVYEGKLIPASP